MNRRRPNRSEYIANRQLAPGAYTIADCDRIRTNAMRERNREAVRAAWAAKREREARAERIARAAFCIIAAALPAVIFLAATSGA